MRVNITRSQAILFLVGFPFGLILLNAFTANLRYILVLAFEWITFIALLGQTLPPGCFAGVSITQSAARAFLTPRSNYSGHPCCSASDSHHQGPQRTHTSKSSAGYQTGQTVRCGAPRHAWRTTNKLGPSKRPESGRNANAEFYFTARSATHRVSNSCLGKLMPC